MSKSKSNQLRDQESLESADQIPAKTPGRRAIWGWMSDPENIAFVGLVALQLVPLWWFQYFPSQDGPDYLQNANIIRSYNDPNFNIVREYYVINKSLTPNWATHLILAGLMVIFKPLVAEKILLSGYVILLPLSVRSALIAIDPRSRFLVVLAFPFIYNSLFHFGFYAFSYSLALFFFVIGYWLKHRDSLTPGKVFKLSILVILLYFAHPTSYVTGSVAVFFLLAWTAVYKATKVTPRKRFELAEGLRSVRSAAIGTICAFIPAFILMIVFFVQHGTQSLPPWPFKTLLTFLPYMSLISYTGAEGTLAVILFCFFILLIGYTAFQKLRQQRLVYSDAMIALAVIYLYLYFSSPRALSGGGLIEQRLVFYPFFALMLWFAGQSFSLMAKLGVQLVALVITAGLLASYWTKYGEINDYLTEYTSGMALIEPNTTLLPLCISHKRLPDGETVSVAVSPFVHAAGYIAAQKQIVALDNHEADTNHFPIQYRSERNPNHHIGRATNQNTPTYSSTLEAQPPEVDILTYGKRTGGQIDYVLVWSGGKNLARSDPKVASIYQQLRIGYDLIYESPGRGLMQLYKIKQ